MGGPSKLVLGGKIQGSRYNGPASASKCNVLYFITTMQMIDFQLGGSFKFVFHFLFFTVKMNKNKTMKTKKLTLIIKS